VPFKNPAELRAYQNRWTKKRRRDWIRDNGPCADCGTKRKLDVEFPVGRRTNKVWTYTEKKRTAMLRGAVVRCRRCREARAAKAVGEKNGRAQLVDAEVRFIRRSTLPVKLLADIFERGVATIYDIRAGRTWRRVPHFLSRRSAVR
jgi:hypothetical protein